MVVPRSSDGADGIRTRDLLAASQTLSQLSYGPSSVASVAVKRAAIMPRVTTDEERRRLKAAYKEEKRAKARQLLILDAGQLNALLDHLDQVGAEEICDDSLQLTFAWARENEIDPDALSASLGNFGGYCDCEVLANVDPDELF